MVNGLGHVGWRNSIHSTEADESASIRLWCDVGRCGSCVRCKGEVGRGRIVSAFGMMMTSDGKHSDGQLVKCRHGQIRLRDVKWLIASAALHNVYRR